MTRITFIEANGREHAVDAQPGRSVMEAAVDHQIPGIVGECGGSAMCATCHVYVESPAPDQLNPVRPEEETMLEFTACERRAQSRLSCQVKVTEALAGSVFRLPERQV
jgi:2Fe-2S ferredoxin